MKTLEQWIYLVRGAVRGVNEYQASAIGKMCFDAQAANQTCNVWHQASLYFGQRCHCRACNPN